MLARVRRIEEARTPTLSPIAQAFGSFNAFTAWADEHMAAGVLDPRDFPFVVASFARYERDGAWGQRQSLPGIWRPGT